MDKDLLLDTGTNFEGNTSPDDSTPKTLPAVFVPVSSDNILYNPVRIPFLCLDLTSLQTMFGHQQMENKLSKQ